MEKPRAPPQDPSPPEPEAPTVFRHPCARLGRPGQSGGLHPAARWDSEDTQGVTVPHTSPGGRSGREAELWAPPAPAKALPQAPQALRPPEVGPFNCLILEPRGLLKGRNGSARAAGVLPASRRPRPMSVAEERAGPGCRDWSGRHGDPTETVHQAPSPQAGGASERLRETSARGRGGARRRGLGADAATEGRVLGLFPAVQAGC